MKIQYEFSENLINRIDIDTHKKLLFKRCLSPLITSWNKWKASIEGCALLKSALQSIK